MILFLDEYINKNKDDYGINEFKMINRHCLFYNRRGLRINDYLIEYQALSNQ